MFEANFKKKLFFIFIKIFKDRYLMAKGTKKKGIKVPKVPKISVWDNDYTTYCIEDCH